MGKKSTPKAPKAPDYAAAATAQGQANQDAARQGAELNNTNQVTPYGSQTFTKDPGSDQWTSTVSLSPDQQQLYDLQTQGDLRLDGMANSQLDRINDSFSQPFDTSGAPDRVNNVAPSSYDLYSGSGPTYGRAGAGPQYGSVGTGPAMQGGNAGPNYAKYTGADLQLPDYGKQAQEVEDSLYGSATKRLDPQYAQQEEALRSRLINSGYDPTSEAYKNEFDRFNNQKQADYGDARDRSIQARGAEQSRLNNDFYTGNAQQFGQKMQSLGFNNDTDARALSDTNTRTNMDNQASQQQFANRLAGTGFDNASAQQSYADALRGTEFNNNASSQEFNNALAAKGFNNNANSQDFNNRLASGNFQNTQRGAAIDEAAYMRNEPLNAYNALNSGSQVTQPQFRGTGQVQGPAATPTFAATQAQDQRAIDLYNAQLASSGSAQGGLMGVLGQLGSSFINRK